MTLSNISGLDRVLGRFGGGKVIVAEVVLEEVVVEDVEASKIVHDHGRDVILKFEPSISKCWRDATIGIDIAFLRHDAGSCE